METFDGVWFYSRKPYKKLHNQRFEKLIILQLTYCRRSKKNTFFIRKKNQIIVITNAQEKNFFTKLCDYCRVFHSTIFIDKTK